jgi:hypothetical protein
MHVQTDKAQWSTQRYDLRTVIVCNRIDRRIKNSTFSFWPLCCLFFFDLRFLITPLISFGHCVVCSSIYVFWLPLWYIVAIVLSVLLRFTDSDYPFGIFWPLCCLFFFDLQILITPLVSCGHCVVYSSSIWYQLKYVNFDPSSNVHSYIPVLFPATITRIYGRFAVR